MVHLGQYICILSNFNEFLQILDSLELCFDAFWLNLVLFYCYVEYLSRLDSCALEKLVTSFLLSRELNKILDKSKLPQCVKDINNH